MTVNILVGELLTGRITDTIPVTEMRWTDVLNAAGSIEITVPEEVVRDVKLRDRSHGMRTFLAVEVDDRIKQAGPITSRGFDWEKGQARFGAQGVWAWLDRIVVRRSGLTLPLAANTFTVADKSLGGIGRALVAQALDTSPVPIVLPADEAGTHTESFPLWSVPRCGEELRQITQRATDAPDIRFTPRRRANDARFIEWVMQVGTEVKPSLSQGGPDWVFDASSPKSSILGISTDEDATQMASRVWVTGNGQEAAILMSALNTTELTDLGWPMTEAEASHSTVEVQSTLDGHAASLLQRLSRPIEVFKVSAHATAYREVLPGDYARTITRGDAWLGDMDRAMRIRQAAGDLTDRITFDMFPLQALL